VCSFFRGLSFLYNPVDDAKVIGKSLNIINHLKDLAPFSGFTGIQDETVPLPPSGRWGADMMQHGLKVAISFTHKQTIWIG